MPRIRFIGNYDILADGKYLFEILAQLKNFGVGRMVVKNEWLRRWPTQPSYCVIRKVEPEMDRWLCRGKMWGDFVYRGRFIGLVEFVKDFNRSDWRLIHKHEEEALRKCDHPFKYRLLPAHIPLPPLEQFMLKKRLKDEGKPEPKEIPMIEVFPHMDEEFELIQDVVKRDELNPPLGGSVYDVDKSIYLDLYGNLLPTKVEKWGDVK